MPEADQLPRIALKGPGTADGRGGLAVDGRAERKVAALVRSVVWLIILDDCQGDYDRRARWVRLHVIRPGRRARARARGQHQPTHHPERGRCV